MVRIVTFALELGAVISIYKITGQNKGKLSKSTFVQMFHLVIFGVTVACDGFIVYITDVQ